MCEFVLVTVLVALMRNTVRRKNYLGSRLKATVLPGGKGMLTVTRVHAHIVEDQEIEKRECHCSSGFFLTLILCSIGSSTWPGAAYIMGRFSSLSYPFLGTPL